MSDPSQHTCGLNGLRIEGVPCPVCAPLSPIALDFAATEKAARKGMTTELFTEWEYRYRDALNTQHRAIVARVAQEEREKCEGRAKELLDKTYDETCKWSDRTYEPTQGDNCRFVAGEVAIKFHGLLLSYLRGTP